MRDEKRPSSEVVAKNEGSPLIRTKIRITNLDNIDFLKKSMGRTRNMERDMVEKLKLALDHAEYMANQHFFHAKISGEMDTETVHDYKHLRASECIDEEFELTEEENETLAFDHAQTMYDAHMQKTQARGFGFRPREHQAHSEAARRIAEEFIINN